jgi:hypothetical protein
MADECSGCPLYVVLWETNVKQCKYFAYKQNIAKCPCKECLLKVICTEFCGDFYMLDVSEDNFCVYTMPTTLQRG